MRMIRKLRRKRQISWENKEIVRELEVERDHPKRGFRLERRRNQKRCRLKRFEMSDVRMSGKEKRHEREENGEREIPRGEEEERIQRLNKKPTTTTTSRSFQTTISES